MRHKLCLSQNSLPEFAFAGKSNVGKSSLINALMQRKSLARTSQTPGKTQTVNFYNVNDEFYFVDLPGYGFTKAAESVKAKWGKMVERYLRSSQMSLGQFSCLWTCVISPPQMTYSCMNGCFQTDFIP